MTPRSCRHRPPLRRALRNHSHRRRHQTSSPRLLPLPWSPPLQGERLPPALVRGEPQGGHCVPLWSLIMTRVIVDGNRHRSHWGSQRWHQALGCQQQDRCRSRRCRVPSAVEMWRVRPCSSMVCLVLVRGYNSQAVTVTPLKCTRLWFLLHS